MFSWRQKLSDNIRTHIQYTDSVLKIMHTQFLVNPAGSSLFKSVFNRSWEFHPDIIESKLSLGDIMSPKQSILAEREMHERKLEVLEDARARLSEMIRRH